MIRSLVHRLIHGHRPDVRPFPLWDGDDSAVPMCRWCLLDAYRDERPALRGF